MSAASSRQDSVILAETLGLTRSSPDYYALELGNNVLGGAFYSTRLTRDIRKDAGLVYSVQSHFQFSQTRGIYLVQYACDPQNVAKVHEMVAREVRQMQAAPVTEDELDEPTIAARRYLGLGAREVQAAFVKWLRPGDLVRVSQGPVP